MKQLRKLLAALLLALLIACDEETTQGEKPIFNGTIEESIEPSKNRPVPFDELSTDILSEIEKMDGYFRSDVNKAKDGSFGEVVRDIAILDNNEDQGKSYTLRMEKLGKGFYFDNLVVQQGSDGKRNVHVVRYTPDKDWYEDTKGQNGRFQSYSGNISVFREDGTWLADMGMVQGKIAKSTTDMSTAQCILQTSYTMGCVYSCWVDSITIDVYCPESNNGSGTESTDNPVPDTPEPVNNDGQGGGGGGSGSSNNNNSVGNNSSIKTSPFDEFIEEYLALEEEDQIIYDNNLLEDYPCQADIIKDALATNSPVTDLVMDIFNSDVKPSITIQADNLNGILEAGNTQAQNGNPLHYFIIMNTQRLDVSTDIDIACTTIHESVHALLFYFLQAGSFQSENESYAQLVEDFVTYWVPNGGNGSPEIQHQYMQDLVSNIADSLYNWALNNDYNPGNFAVFDTVDTNNFDGMREYFGLIAWNGLTDRDAFKELYPLGTLSYINALKIINSESFPYEYNANPQGEPCN